MDTIKVGFIGLGQRGGSLLKDIVLKQGVLVTAVCDLYDDRCEKGAESVKEAGFPMPKIYKDYKELIEDKEVNTVIVATSWETHIDVAVCAMENGKPVGMEVGGAYSVEDCWKLVRAYEKMQTPFMFLENCCFGRRELMALNMVKQGIFGEIVHCDGGYCHDLRKEVSYGKENRHYRLRNYLMRNCENYPTHELGPIARILNINHGNKMLTLTSVASKSAGLHNYILENKSNDEELIKASFAQGDIVTTVIKCAGGETITITLDTTLPRYYSRNFTVRGTKGMYEEATDSIFIDRIEDRLHDLDWRKECINNATEYEKEFEHPIWKEFIAEGVQGGHDGMDWLTFRTFFDCLKNDKEMPIDVYDAASWMVITALSEISIANGGTPVEIPDFTNGKWILR